MYDISLLPNILGSTANLPNGEMQDDAIPGDGGGNPVRKDWMQDMYYSDIALMYKYGFTPDGSEEGIVTSQKLSAIMKALVTKELESVSISKTILATDLVALYEIDTSGGDIILTLPAVAGLAGKTVEVILTTIGAANKFTLKGSVAEQINGVNTQVLRSLNDRIRVYCDGTSWHILDILATYDTGWINRSDWTDVHMGSNTTKNVDSDLSHNLGIDLSELSVKFLISTDGADNNSFESGMVDNSVANVTNIAYGVRIDQIDIDNLLLQTGEFGISSLTTSGLNLAIDSEDWYYRIIISRLK